MALFSKPPPKKPQSATPEPRMRPGVPPPPASARRVVSEAGGHIPVDRRAAGMASARLVSLQPAIEVEESHSALCAVLENAALLHANNQAEAAQEVLVEGIGSDAATRETRLAWLALFDLLERAGDKATFDQLALKYVMQFEESAPAWRPRQKMLRGPQRSAPRGTAITVAGALGAGSVLALEPLRRLTASSGPHRLELARVTGFDEPGALLLARALQGARRQKAPLKVEDGDKLRTALESTVATGRAAGEGPWQLLLELLQWQGDQPAFDDRAIEYAVTFELSPPSWDPPATAVAAEPDKAGVAAPVDYRDTVAWADEITGSATRLLGELDHFAQSRLATTIDMSAVERIDFVASSAITSAIGRIEGHGRQVRLAGTPPIIQALLMIVGLTSEHFVRKPD